MRLGERQAQGRTLVGADRAVRRRQPLFRDVELTVRDQDLQQRRLRHRVCFGRRRGIVGESLEHTPRRDLVAAVEQLADGFGAGARALGPRHEIGPPVQRQPAHTVRLRRGQPVGSIGKAAQRVRRLAVDGAERRLHRRPGVVRLSPFKQQFGGEASCRSGRARHSQHARDPLAHYDRCVAELVEGVRVDIRKTRDGMTPF